jgi:hypothetical protein
VVQISTHSAHPIHICSLMSGIIPTGITKLILDLIFI